MRTNQSFSFLFVLFALPASAASYKLVPFRIPGATSISVTAINDLGNAVGDYTNSAGTYAFIGPSGRVKRLGLVFQGAYTSAPSAVNDSNVVVGDYFDGAVTNAFVWQNGTYTYSFASNANGCPLDPPSLNAKGQIAYNEFLSCQELQAYAGPPSHLQLVGNVQAASINKSGQVAGDDYFGPGGPANFSVFLETAGVFLSLAPSNATGSSGGYVNDSGHVAGWYVDTSNAVHGFLYVAGTYTSFDMPSTAVTIAIQGIDNRDQVVGTYTDTTRRYAFIYANGTVTRYGSWPTNYVVKASVSTAGTHGAIAAGPNSGPTVSYLVQCTGHGC